MTLHLADKLTLPDDAVTETFAILAKRGAGKSNAAVVMAEQMHDAGLGWVAIDPKGDWWGIRSSADGKQTGLPVLILGGKHADVPLEPSGGRLVADLIVDQHITCIIDVSLMSKTSIRTFLADFAERLYQRNEAPLHVFAEEAHEYIPQRVTAGDARMVGAWEKLVKWGRTHGLGVTLITQRSASLNKDVLTQVETLIALRTTAPQDRNQIRAWVEEHEAGAAMIAQLNKLTNGEAFVLSPQWLELDEPLRVRFARRRTFDSGATPKAGQKRVTPRTLAQVDLAALKDAMADTIEKAKADDPKALRARIAELERALAAEKARPAPAPTVERVEVPVLPDDTADKVKAALEPASDLLRGVLSALQEAANNAPAVPYPPAPLPKMRVTREQVGPTPPAIEHTIQESARATMRDGDGLSKAERRILTVLAQHGSRTTTQVAILTGYSHKSGGFRNALSKLRTAGFIEGRGDITITRAGEDALGVWETLPYGSDLREWWKQNQLGKAERAILDVLADAYPRPVEVAAIAEATGYSPTSGGFRNAMSKLRTLELASGRGELVLSDQLADLGVTA